MYVVKGRVTGKVQGVSFRVHTQAIALKHNLSGWAKNKTDASVEVLLQGKKEDVITAQTLIELGPALSRVDGVIWQELDAPEFEQFLVGIG